MIIVSQDKDVIVNFDNVVSVYVIRDALSEEKGLENYNIDYSTNDEINIVIGTYATKERAKEILKMIVSAYQSYKLFQCTNNAIQEEIAKKYQEFSIIPFKFEMPQE